MINSHGHTSEVPQAGALIATEDPLARTAEALASDIDRTHRGLVDFASTPEFTDAATATALLNLTNTGLLELVGRGELDAVVVSGRPYVGAAGLQAFVRARMSDQMADMHTLRVHARLALSGYLLSREATGSWQVAIEQGRPLVCRRRGNPDVHLCFGIEMHQVVVNARSVSRWASTEGLAEHPELAELPTGLVLQRALVELAGVYPVSSGTPLFDGKAKSLSLWVRVDPCAWTIRLPEAVALAVGPPAGRG